MTDEQYAILEDIYRDLQTLKAVMDKAQGRPVTHPVKDIPLIYQGDYE